jgi:outer membrane protein TolC
MTRLTLVFLLAAAPQRPDSVLTLSEAARLALETHPATRAAAATTTAARAAVGEARSRWLPHLTSQASLTRFEEPMLVVPIHGFDQAQVANIAFDQTLVQGTMSVAFTVFDGGTRGARIRSALAEADARAAGAGAVEADLLDEVTYRYLEVVTSEAILDAQDEGLRALAAERDRVVQLVAEGEAAEVELLRVKAAVAQAQADRVGAATALAVARAGLARSVGVETLGATTVRPVRFTAGPPPARETLLAALPERNPRLVEAERVAESARAGHRAAVGAWFPQLDAVGGLLLYGSGGGDFTTEWQAGLRLSYPLFLGGSRVAAVRRAGALATAAEERRRLAILEAEDALDRALGAVAESDARLTAAEEAVRHLADVARIDLLALGTGTGTEAEYLRSEAEARRARAQLAQARAGAVAARVTLARLTGDLSLEWLHRTVEPVP